MHLEKNVYDQVLKNVGKPEAQKVSHAIFGPAGIASAKGRTEFEDLFKTFIKNFGACLTEKYCESLYERLWEHIVAPVIMYPNLVQSCTTNR